MGVIPLPVSGAVYLDANAIIYSVEKIEPFRSLLQPVWDGARRGTFVVLTSELSLLETLVKPLQVGDALLEATYRSLLTASREVQLVSLSRAVILRAAELRAKHGLKTADALHAASGQSCMLLVTNDPAFQRVPGLPVVLLRDLVGP